MVTAQTKVLTLIVKVLVWILVRSPQLLISTRHPGQVYICASLTMGNRALGKEITLTRLGR